MKKILATVAVALVASSMVFAGISGYGQLSYGYDLDTKDTGFKNDTNLKVDVDVATASAEKQAEGAIYAKVAGSLKVWAFNGQKGAAVDNPDGTVKPAIAITDISASLNGADWSLNILGMPSKNDFAKSAIDKETIKYEDDDYGFDKPDYDKYKSYSVSYVKAPGFGFTYKGYTLGLGFNYKDTNSTDKKTLSYDKYDEDTKQWSSVPSGEVHNYYKGVDISAIFTTPDIKIQDVLTVKAGVSYFQNETATLKTTTDKTVKGTDKKKLATDRGSAVGGSVAVAYAGDAFTAKVAADLGYALKVFKANGTEVATLVEETEKENKFSMDTSAKIVVDPVTVDVYYYFNGAEADVKKANFLSAQVKADLNSFDVPVAVSVYGKDVIKTQKIGGSVEVKPVDGLKVVAGGSYTIADKVWSVDASAEYAFDMATLAAKAVVGNVGSDKKADGNASDIALGFDVSVKSTTLVPGAELSLAYAADDVLNNYNADKDLDNGHLGSVTAKCKVSF